MKINLAEITPKDAILAYQATGLTPIFDSWGDGVECGCVLTALFLSRHAGEERTIGEFLGAARSVEGMADFLEVPESDLEDFVNGFDAVAWRVSAPLYLIGQAAREAVRGKFDVM